MIELKNIDLSGVSVIEQTEKVDEEFQEFKMALVYESKENVIGEFWDVVQAIAGLAERFREITAEELMDGYPRHLDKIKHRPR